MAVRRLLGVATVSVALAACAGAPTPSPTSAPTGTPAATATEQAITCTPLDPALRTPGRLTMGTDNPAFPPYFEGREGGNTEPWDPEWGDPTTGTGFESAVAYAVAGELGFSNDRVDWVVVPFTSSFAPGPKDFDFNINQVSIKPERAENVDFSEPYYFGQQAVVVAADGPFGDATTVTELKTARLGAQVATTSYDAIVNVIQPTPDVSVYDTNDLAIQALAETDPPQIDGIVVDLPTAFFIVNVQTEGLTVLGQLGEGSGAEPEEWGLVLEKDSPFTECVDAAVSALRADGTLDMLVDAWLEDRNVPELQP